MLCSEIATGEPVRVIKLRRDDFLVEMQEDFNAMLDVLDTRGAVQVVAPKKQADIQQTNTH